MQFKREALMLRSVDFGESDRMVTLLTAEGKLSASMKGVRKASAKLRFAAQPFCFAEYVFSRTGARNTVISASIYDGFYALRENISCFYAAAVVSEACDKLVYEDTESGAFLVAAVNALKELCSEHADARGILVGFLLRALSLAGYAVRADVCPVCRKRPRGLLRFSMESGAFGCAECLSEGVRASENTFTVVNAALDGKTSDDEDGKLRALRLLNAYFENRTETPLPALKEFLKL